MIDDGATALAEVDDLELPFDMDEGDKREASRALEELSDEARYYGSSRWLTPDDTPRQVVRLILKAAARHMKNYEGYITSRAGDETVTWSDRGEQMGDAQFTKDERTRLKELGGNYRPGVQTASMFGWQRRNNRCGPRSEEYVPTDRPGERPFPYGDPREPW